MRVLTAKQRLFVSEYLIDMNATQAAIRAGYSARSADKIGHELLEKTRVSETIQRMLNEREQRTLITADYVLTSLKAVAERCMQAEPVLDREGRETGEYRFDSAGAVRALDLLGRNQGIFEKDNEQKSKVRFESLPREVLQTIKDRLEATQVVH